MNNKCQLMYIFKVTNLQNNLSYIGFSKFDYTKHPAWKLQQNVNYDLELRKCIKDRNYDLISLGDFPDPLVRVIRNDLVKQHKTMQPHGYNTSDQLVYDTDNCLLIKQLLSEQKTFLEIGKRIGCDQHTIRNVNKWLDEWFEQYLQHSHSRETLAL